ncbi:MAG: VCBS repeat-containing protein [Acidobacteria bacterium]|nr:VCBS repeat-containing protein [Acidobacteriota bacterium]
MFIKKDHRRFAAYCSRFVTTILPQRVTAVAVLLLLLATVVGAISIKAFSPPAAANSQPANGHFLQVASLSAASTARFKESGKPWINFDDGKDLESSYTGDAKAIEVLARNAAKPLALTSGDFDGDGVSDAVAGYSSANGGIVVVYRGNADAIYPNAPEAQLHKKQGTFTTAPYLSPALVYEAPAAPEFFAAGDFDGDGRADLILANRDSNQLFIMKGTGRGSFESSAWLDLPGAVTALAVGDVNRGDGLPDIAVAVATPLSAQLMVWENPTGAFNAKPEVFALPIAATAVAIGQLDAKDSFADIAIAAGSTLKVIHGRDRKLSLDVKAQSRVAPAATESRTLDVTLRGIAIGDFTDKVDNDLAVLGDDGAVQLLNRVPGPKGKPVDSLQGWRTRRLNTPRLAKVSQLVAAKLSSLPYESLLVTDTASNQVQFLTDGTDSGRKERQNVAVPALASALLEVDSGAAAVMTGRLNSDAVSDLVVLRGGQSALSIVSSTVASTFTVTNTNDSGAGSLRQAILDANANAGADSIDFAIGSGTQTITPVLDLPPVTDPVTIDGTTQPGFAGTPIIELNGQTTQSGRVFKVSGGTTTIRGLVINRCLLVAVGFQNNGNDKLEGCYIGTDVAGTTAVPNADGVSVFGITNSTVGGTTTAARNVISGNSADGVDIAGNVAGSNLVQGNYIGVNAAGSAALGNLGNGVYLLMKNNTVGGTTTAARNIISGNGQSGILILNDNTITTNLVQGNYIGTDAAGTAALGNSEGISILNAPTTTIGGTVAGAGNLIAGNTGKGVFIAQDKATGNLVQGNIIGAAGLGNTSHGVHIDLASGNTIGGANANFKNFITYNGGNGVTITGGVSANGINQNAIGFNVGLGIDLGNDGVTANDALDPDSGDNDLQNYPVLTKVTGGSSITVEGTFNSIPNQTYLLEFYLNGSCDPSNYGEGGFAIGALYVTTNASGNATFNSTFAVPGVAGQSLTATATAANASTSEFSQCAPVCVYSIAPTSQSFTETGGTGSVNVTTGSGCAWTAVSNDSFITITSGASSTGNGTVNFSVAANPNPATRTGTMTIAGQTFTVMQAAAPCTYSILPTSQSYNSAGGTGSVAVTATTGCPWTAVSNDAFITITSGASGTGNGTVNYSVAAKTDPGSRTGTMTIAGQTFTVTQSGTDCTYSIAPTNQNFVVGGGTGTVNVTAASVCAWTAASNAAWITITSGASGTGNGAVNYSVAANPNPGNRTGTMTIAGQTFTVTQDGTNPCTYTIAPTSQVFGASGGGGSVTVTTGNTCAWSAVSNVAWITITSGASGTGSGLANYTVAVNSQAAIRTGTVTVAGQTFTVTQAGASCISTISPNGAAFTAAGGSGLISVTAALGCNWTSTSLDAWITITAGATGSGSQKVKYTVAANSSTSARSGNIIVGNQVHVVTQAGATCLFTISPTSQNFVAAGGTGSVGVTTTAGCNWTAVSNAGFITITSGASGTGNGTVNYSVAANISASPRSGTMTIAGQTFTVTQDAAAGSCVYSIVPSSQNFPVGGGTGSVAVTATAGCAWTAVSNDSFITVTSGASGTGNGTVNFSVAANSNPAPRSGTMTVAGQTFTVTQDGNCTFSISPSGRIFSAASATGTVSVTAPGGCVWNATSNAAWITIISGATGSGNGTVTYSVSANTTGASRTGTITVAGQTHTVKQGS